MQEILQPKLFTFTFHDSVPFCDLQFDRKETVDLGEYEGHAYDYFGTARADFRDFGTKWYDILRSSAGPVLISDNVVDVFRRENVTGIEFNDVVIENVESRSLSKLTPPKYYWIKSKGKLRVDDLAYGLSGLHLSENNKRILEGWTPGRRIPLMETWSGEDFSRLMNPRPGGYICTRKVIELAHEHKWTNLWLFPLDCVVTRRNRFAINYLGKKWPPQWYPDGFEPDPRNLES
ncbi:MAG: hypothetical protein AAFX93_01245 [Verrucomicrobiota bacterium]